MDPLKLTIFKNKLTSIAEEMGIVLQRTAFSPNIKERKDLSCALFRSDGTLVAQAEHIPVHLGSMSSSVKEVLKVGELKEGDIYILNDPYRGGTHLPDITLVAPFFYRGELLFILACRAHHSDVGGITPGSMPLSTDIFQEGLIIPPVKLLSEGKLNSDLLNLITSNVRTPREREGDLRAQIMALETGKRRLSRLVGEMGQKGVLEASEQLLAYTERFMRATLKNIPDGEYSFEDYLEDDGLGRERIAIRVRINIEGDSALVDFSRTDPQSTGPVNSVRSVTTAAVYYCFRALLPEEVPTNDGCFRPIEIKTKKGTVVDALFPCAVSAGNVETSQRIVDVVLGALAQALPDIIPSASQGTMNNLAIGGESKKFGSWSYYETIGGGMGAWKGGEGESAVHSHMTNTMNTPVEALEHSYPIRVTEYSVRRGSGGSGKKRGGDGIIREILLLEPARVSLISERRKLSPYGLFGGKGGKPGLNLVIEGNETKAMPSKFTAKLGAGTKIRIETPGGGGYG
jgi:N-methylhydantoinase B